MAMLEGLLKSIENKIRMLEFTSEDIPTVLDKKHVPVPTMERKLKTLNNKLQEVHDLEVQAQEAKIEKDENPNEIRKWSAEIEGEVAKFEQSVQELQEAIKRANQTEIEQTKMQEEEFATKLREQQFEQEMKFEQAKLQLEKSQLESSKKQENEAKAHTKLPKLVITKFKGVAADWLRFWSQFETEVDRAEIAQVTKFSYLKELLEPKVRTTIDGLPFTTEGYERAKNILKTKYGKTSEIVNAYVLSILSELTQQKFMIFMRSWYLASSRWKHWEKSRK
jgi:chromosome segregation ATPase